MGGRVRWGELEKEEFRFIVYHFLNAIHARLDVDNFCLRVLSRTERFFRQENSALTSSTVAHFGGAGGLDASHRTASYHIAYRMCLVSSLSIVVGSCLGCC